jgi:hypothetical protein
MPSRLTLAAGVLGVASLAFVGVGGYAAFTSNVNLDTSATAGTFLLNAKVGTTGEGCASGNTQASCLFFDANNYTNNIGGFSSLSNNTNITSDGDNALLKWDVPNMAPGDYYFADIYLRDVGTLQGKVSEVTYTPPTGTPSQLLKDMTVTVQEFTGTKTVINNNGVSTSVKVWTNLPRIHGNNIDGSQVGAGNYAANGTYTFSTAVNNSQVPFLQPLGVGTDEQSAEFRVIYTLNDSATNVAEGENVAPSLSFVGTSIP